MILSSYIEVRQSDGTYLHVDPPTPEPLSMSYDGRAKWEAWHRRAVAHDGSDDTAWVMRLLADIPVECCGEDFHRWLALHPPRWNDYFAWTVEAHNVVNLRLDRPALTIAQARAIWAP